MSMWEQFGDKPNNWIKMSDFDGEGRTVTFKGFSKALPEDEDFTITGTMNKVVKDKKGKKILTKNGEEITNSYYDPDFPKGYQIIMDFEEGTLNVSSFPFLKQFNIIRPEEGQSVHIRRAVPDGDKTKTNFQMKIVDMDFAGE